MNKPGPLLASIVTTLALGIAHPTVAAPKYTVTKLGSLGGTLTVPLGINNSGRVVGQAERLQVNRAFLYSHGMMEDVGTLGGEAIAQDINNSGVIVGWAQLSSGGIHPFRYHKGQMQDLGTLAGDDHAVALAINNRGEIVGESGKAGESSSAFLFKNGRMHDLGGFGGPYSGAGAINDSGEIVGSAVLPNGQFHAFLYKRGVMRDLGTLGGSFSGAGDINNRGQIVGVSLVSSDEALHGFLYENGRMIDLGTLGGPTNIATAINNHGVIVGYSDAADTQHAFVYIDGVMHDLHDSIVAAEPSVDAVSYSFANAINERGQIAVHAEVRFMRGVEFAAEVRAYILSPLHEDAKNR